MYDSVSTAFRRSDVIIKRKRFKGKNLAGESKDVCILEKIVLSEYYGLKVISSMFVASISCFIFTVSDILCPTTQTISSSTAIKGTQGR